MTPKAKYYETLANTMIKNFEKRRMEALPPSLTVMPLMSRSVP